MPTAYRKLSHAEGSLYPELDQPYPLAVCVVAWVVVFSIVLAVIFSTAAFAISVSAAVASAITVARN